jgi:hypothetical protein
MFIYLFDNVCKLLSWQISVVNLEFKVIFMQYK